MAVVLISASTAWLIAAIVLGVIAVGGLAVWIKARYF